MKPCTWIYIERWRLCALFTPSSRRLSQKPEVQNYRTGGALSILVKINIRRKTWAEMDHFRRDSDVYFAVNENRSAIWNSTLYACLSDANLASRW